MKINHAWLENATISLTKTERKRQEQNIERVKKTVLTSLSRREELLNMEFR